MSAPAARTVSLLGAPSTGKTQLAQKLAAHFRAQGWRVAIIEGMRLEVALPAHDLEIRDGGPLTQNDATLVTGLDLPAQAQPHHYAFDAQLRRALQDARIPYQVVYGQGEARLASALAALARNGIGTVPERAPQRAWTWVCEKCSDPECEHRLFRGLTA